MGDGYRVRSEEIWDRARSDYIAGFAAEEVCRRYDLGLSALRKRASREHWRRADQPAANYIEDDLEIFADLDTGDMAEMARLRMAAAIARGQSGEAARWKRIHADLRVEHQDEVWLERDRAIGRLGLALGRSPAPTSVPPPGEADAQPEADASQFHQFHPNFSGDAPDPSISRQVRRQLERQAAKRS